MKKLCIMLALALAAMTASASVTYSPFVMGAMDDLGNEIVDGTFMLVLDLDGDGWNGTSYLAQGDGSVDNASSWNWDSDDIVALGVIDDSAIGVLDLQIPTPPAGYDAEVDHYYVLWFDVAYNTDGPGLNTVYGAIDMGAVGKDPGTYTPDVIYPGMADMVTVPEPATLSLLAFGFLPALRRRTNR